MGTAPNFFSRRPDDSKILDMVSLFIKPPAFVVGPISSWIKLVTVFLLGSGENNGKSGFSLNIFMMVGIYSLYLSLFKSTCFWTLILFTSFPTGPCPSNLTPASLNNFFAVIGLLTSIASEIISSMDVTPLFGDVNDLVARLSSYICLAISPFKLLSKLLGSSSYNSNSFSYLFLCTCL